MGKRLLGFPMGGLAERGPYPLRIVTEGKVTSWFAEIRESVSLVQPG